MSSAVCVSYAVIAMILLVHRGPGGTPQSLGQSPGRRGAAINVLS